MKYEVDYKTAYSFCLGSLLAHTHVQELGYHHLENGLSPIRFQVIIQSKFDISDLLPMMSWDRTCTETRAYFRCFC